MGPYRNCYERVYIFSPACAPGVDAAWDAWGKHVRIHMIVPDEEQTLFDRCEPDILEKYWNVNKRTFQEQEANQRIRNLCRRRRLC